MFSLFSLLSMTVLLVPMQEPQQVRKFVISPQAVPSPALRYLLLPPMRDLQTGNAVQGYYRCFAPDVLYFMHRNNFDGRMYAWLNLPFEQASRVNSPSSTPQLPQAQKKSAPDDTDEIVPGTREEMSFLRNFQTLDDLDFAARRTHADWDYLEQMKSKGMLILLPELQGMRILSNLVHMRARLALMDMQFERSLYHLQTGMAMAQHFNQAYLFIYSMTGDNVAKSMLKVVAEFIQVPQAPNLYWALSDLPQPLFNLRQAYAGDRLAIEYKLGDPKQLEERIFSIEEMQSLINTKIKPLLRMNNQNDNNDLTLLFLKEYPHAKAWLLEQGRSTTEIEKMTAAQAVLLYARSRFQILADDFAKHFQLPLTERLEHANAFQQKMKDLRKQKDTSYFLGYYFFQYYPNVWAVMYDTDREIALLRCVELLRHYITGHDHKLPENWDMVKDLPVPVDPVTGKRFGYQLQGNHAVITMEAISNAPTFRTARQIEVYVK